jgi:hypothetical protein
LKEKHEAKVHAWTLAYHVSLFIDKDSQVFENFIDFTNLLMNLPNALLSLLNHCFIEYNFIFQLEEILPSLLSKQSSLLLIIFRHQLKLARELTCRKERLSNKWNVEFFPILSNFLGILEFNKNCLEILGQLCIVHPLCSLQTQNNLPLKVESLPS